jgi:hypothetical protein
MSHALYLQVIEVLQQEEGIAGVKTPQKLIARQLRPWQLPK